MSYNPNKHNRKSIRLKGYDYSQAGLYFITICCQDKAHLFGKIENGIMLLNDFGQIAHNEWKYTEKIRDNIHIHDYIIMPDHIHGIIEILFKKNEKEETQISKFTSPSQSLGSIIRGYKIATIKKIKEHIHNKEDLLKSTGELQFAPTNPTVRANCNSPQQFTLIAKKKILALNYKIWQRNYYETIIRNKTAYKNISNYIRNNPKNWKE